MTKQTTYTLLFILLGGLFQSIFGQSVNNYGHAQNILMRTGTFYTNYTYFFSNDSNTLHKDTLINIPSNSTPYNLRYAVFSDKSGNLKLYSNGKYAWNGNYQRIDSNILIPINNHDLNVAVPMPGNHNLIYIFSLFKLPSSPDYLYYALVDMSGNNGLGSVAMYGQKFAPYGLAGGLALTKHANGRDYWLVSKKEMTNQYIAFHIKPGGAVDTVFSQVGIHPNSQQVAGIMKFSPDGKWLADNLNFLTTKDTMQLLSFDASTGVLSDTNARYVPPWNPFDHIGIPLNIEFSSNSRFAYVSQGSSYEKRFYQYDLFSADQQTFFSNKVMVKNYIFPNGQYNFYQMNLAANGNIYNPSSDNAYGMFFNTIENPNQLGATCNWQQHNYIINNSISYCEYDNFRFSALPGCSNR